MWPRARFVHHVIATQTARNNAAGIKAPRIRSWVLMTRSVRPVAVIAIECAPRRASPSRISTSDGGTTTPKVAATAIEASRVAGGTPASRRRGATVLASASTDAPTDPFIGPSSAPSAMPATDGAAGDLGSRAAAERNNAPATGSRLSSAPISKYSGSACRTSLSKRPINRDGSARSRSMVNRPDANPAKAPIVEAASSTT